MSMLASRFKVSHPLQVIPTATWFCHSIWHFIRKNLRQIFSDILFWHFILFSFSLLCHFIFAFSLASILTSSPASLLASFLTTHSDILLILYGILSDILLLAFFVALYVAFYVIFYAILVLSHPFVFTLSLNSILPDLNQEHQISPSSLGPVVPTKIWSSGLGSGSVYWDLGSAVTSSIAHWDLKLAVEVRQVPIEIGWVEKGMRKEGRKEGRQEGTQSNNSDET